MARRSGIAAARYHATSRMCSCSARSSPFSRRRRRTASRLAPVERIDTHISIVWLAADRAFKLKRAVHYDYVDFSTLERRRAACEAEVRLNRRTAPSLYLGVRAVTREADGSLALGGTGEPVEWLVEMTAVRSGHAVRPTRRAAAASTRR